MSLKLSNNYNLWEQILNYIMNFPSRDNVNTQKQTIKQDYSDLLDHVILHRQLNPTTEINHININHSLTLCYQCKTNLQKLMSHGTNYESLQ